jgi:hypothetical protein
MFDIGIDSFNIKIFIILAQSVNGLHSKGMLQDFLCGVKKDIFELITEVEGLGQDPKEFWLLKANA